ncbi:MAG: hypothetical protein PHH11_01275 [Methylomonas sp.]|nr:hypothetical protein [Methylomonas sp.]
MILHTSGNSQDDVSISSIDQTQQQFESSTEKEAAMAVEENDAENTAAITVADANMNVTQPVQQVELSCASNDAEREKKVDDEAGNENGSSESSNEELGKNSEPSSISEAESLAAEIDKLIIEHHSAKTNPLLITQTIEKFLRAEGFKHIKCSDKLEYFNTRLKDKGVKQSTFYRYCAAAEFASKNNLEISSETEKALNAIVLVPEKNRDDVWNKAKGSEDYPKAIDIRDGFKKLKAQAVNDQGTDQPVDQRLSGNVGQSKPPGSKVQAIFSALSSLDEESIKKVVDEISSRISKIEQESYGIEALGNEELLELQELFGKLLKEREHDPNQQR